MSAQPVSPAGRHRFVELYHQALRALVRGLAFVAGAGLMVMVLVTTVEVLLRIHPNPQHLWGLCRPLAWLLDFLHQLFGLGYALPGAYDVVRIAAAVTLAAALPYTTAIKGHVAIEYFFHRLGRRGRVVVDTLMRLIVIGLFSLLAWGCVGYGNALRVKGEVSMTVQLPVFWVPYLLAFSCGLVVLITLHHLLHPGKEMIKP